MLKRKRKKTQTHSLPMLVQCTISPFKPSAPPMFPLSCTDPSMTSQSSAPPWLVDPSGPPQAFKPRTPFRPPTHWLHLGLMLPQLHHELPSFSLHCVPSYFWLHLGPSSLWPQTFQSVFAPRPSTPLVPPGSFFPPVPPLSSFPPCVPVCQVHASTSVMPACSSTMALQTFCVIRGLRLHLSQSSWFCLASLPRFHH